VISEFGEMLGKSDIQNQESVLDLARENIEILEREARETAKIKGKLYRNMGVLSGAAVVILLL
jgi:stage III sporulation protein AB